MDASNEALFGIGLDEFIEFIKGGLHANTFTQTKVGREGATD